MLFESARFSYEIHENLIKLAVPFGSVHGSLTLNKFPGRIPSVHRCVSVVFIVPGRIFKFSSRECVKEEAELINSM